MAKRQTRRTISVKGITYQRLKDYCDDIGSSVSGWLEDTIKEKLDAAGAPTPTVLKVSKRRSPTQAEILAAQTPANFTF